MWIISYPRSIILTVVDILARYSKVRSLSIRIFKRLKSEFMKIYNQTLAIVAALLVERDNYDRREHNQSLFPLEHFHLEIFFPCFKILVKISKILLCRRLML